MDKIDKKKEIEELIKKQRELTKSSEDLSFIIEKIREEIEVSRENELFEENQFQKEKILKLESDLKKAKNTSKKLKNALETLVDELKEIKAKNRSITINGFESAILKVADEDFEKKLVKKLESYQRHIKNKVHKVKNELTEETQEKVRDIRKKLDLIEKEAETLIGEEKRKIRKEKIEFDSEIRLFTSDVETQYNEREDKYLYEREKKNFTLEKLIGLKGFQLVGILSIFIAIVIFFREEFVKLFNNNYGKSVFSYMIGMGFIGYGEYLYKKRKKTFAVGLIGGGIGILYLATILSSTYLHLYPLNVGLLLAVILTAFTVAMSFKYDSQIIGIITLVGGYIPYGTSLTRLLSNIQYRYIPHSLPVVSANTKENIIYLAAYSIILQFVVLAVSWKKNWKYSRIIGFVIGGFNGIHIMTYMYNLNINIYVIYAYLLAFSTMYSYVFLKGAERENRKEKAADYVFLGINLLVKFLTINILAYVGKISTTEKAVVFLLVGFMYTLLSQRLKGYNLSKVFIFMGLASFIVVVPVLVPRGYLPLAWGLETILIYLLAKKENEKGLLYGGVVLYVITLLANLPIMAVANINFNLLSGFILDGGRLVTVNTWIYFANQIMVIALSFGVYSITVANRKPSMKAIGYSIKYITLSKAILDFIDIVHFTERRIKAALGLDDSSIFHYKEVAKILLIIFVVIFIVRKLTYKLKKYQDDFSLIYLSIVEAIGTLAICYKIPIMYPHRKVILFEPFLVTLVLMYLFLVLRKDLHNAFFKNQLKKIQWILGESIYIVFMSAFLLNKYNVPKSQLIINIIGLIVSTNLIWKGFKAPNKNLRRLGLAIGIIFTLKGFVDFARSSLEANYKVIGYAMTGIILVGISYIYASALKNLETLTPDDDPNKIYDDDDDESLEEESELEGESEENSSDDDDSDIKDLEEFSKKILVEKEKRDENFSEEKSNKKKIIVVRKKKNKENIDEEKIKEEKIKEENIENFSSEDSDKKDLNKELSQEESSENMSSDKESIEDENDKIIREFEESNK